MSRATYGQDAPRVVSGLAAGGGAALIAAALLRNVHALASFGDGLMQAGIAMLLVALWMIWSSRWGKSGAVRRLLDRHDWRGDEAVLDVGCGRGLATVAAAKRTPGGHVTGLDSWSNTDLSGNSRAAAEENARIEGVSARVSIETGDARALPYRDGVFDVVTSVTVLHNIPSAGDRRLALVEALRVLRPGGALLIFDIRHPWTYARDLRAVGAEARLVSISLLWMVPGGSVVAVKR